MVLIQQRICVNLSMQIVPLKLMAVLMCLKFIHQSALLDQGLCAFCADYHILIIFLQVDLTWFDLVVSFLELICYYLNPLHYKGHVNSNFQKLLLDRHPPQIVLSRLKMVISVGKGYWYLGYLAIFI